MISAPSYGRACGWAVAFALLLPTTASGQVRQALFQGGAPQGQPAASGGLFGGGSSDWVNAHGDPVVMPASYCGDQCGPGMMGGGYGPACGPGGGCGPMANCCNGSGGPYPCGGPQGSGYGMDPACEEYGLNLGPDQCGPHYFDFSVEALYWDKERPADPSRIFATIGITDVSMGVNPDLALTTDDVEFEWEPGLRLIGRYDLGALSVLEVAYSGLFEYGAVSGLEGNGNIFTGFSNFGTDPFGGVGLDSTEAADSVELQLLSELHNGEISFRRYWVGWNPRVTGTWLAGVRYTRVSETLNFTTIASSGNAFFSTRTTNDLVGAQIGGDAWVTVRQGCRIGAQGKAGIYNNRAEYRNNVDSTALADPVFEVAKGNRVAFIGEGNVSAVFDILPSWSLRAGYDVLFINTMALAANNFDFNNELFLSGSRTPVLIEESSSLYHGANIGLEYVW
jgi:hypothetical protein